MDKNPQKIMLKTVIRKKELPSYLTPNHRCLFWTQRSPTVVCFLFEREYKCGKLTAKEFKSTQASVHNWNASIISTIKRHHTERSMLKKRYLFLYQHTSSFYHLIYFFGHPAFGINTLDSNNPVITFLQRDSFISLEMRQIHLVCGKSMNYEHIKHL